MFAAPPNEAAATAPRHLAVIMDGNGRWAKQRGRPRTLGHRAGARAVNLCIDWCIERGIAALTLFAFSSENWQRPAEEVSALMGLFLRALDREARIERRDARHLGQLRQPVTIRHQRESRKRILLPPRGKSREQLFVLGPENVQRKKPPAFQDLPQRTVMAQRERNHRRLEPRLLDKAAQHPDPPSLVHRADRIKPAGNPPQGRFQSFVPA